MFVHAPYCILKPEIKSVNEDGGDPEYMMTPTTDIHRVALTGGIVR